VQKLCYYANSGPCDEEDPEFLRIRQAYVDSNFNYKALVRELFSSPLITLAAPTKTYGPEKEQPINISRREHFCVALSHRLGLTDICGFDAITPSPAQKDIQLLSLSMPESSYSRGAESPALARDPNLFFRASVENICQKVSDQVIDPMSGTGRYSSTNSTAAIDDFVATVMAMPPSDGRGSTMRQILIDHYNAALKQSGVMARDALRSTFMLACTSPTSVSVGL
jgi:hypothetical protein